MKICKTYCLTTTFFLLFSLCVSASTGKANAPSGLTLRSGPGKGQSKITSIPKDSSFEILEKNGPQDNIENKTANWYKIKFGDKIGWVFGGFVLEEESTIQSQNVVESPSPTSDPGYDIIPGESFGNFKIGLSEKESKKLQSQSSTALEICFKNKNICQITTSDSKYSVAKKVFVGCTLANYLAMFPASEKSFAHVFEEASDPTAYFFDKKSGIGVSFQIADPFNLGKSAPNEIIIAELFIFSKDTSPNFRGNTPLPSDPVILIPGESLGEIKIGMTSKEVHEITGTPLDYGDSPNDCFENGKLLQTSTENPFCLIEGKISLCNDLKAFYEQFPRAVYVTKTNPENELIHYVYDKNSGVGLSWKNDAQKENLSPEKIYPYFFGGARMYLFAKNTEPPFLRTPKTETVAQLTAEMPKVIPQELPQPQQMQPSRPTGNTPHNGVRSPAVQTTSPVQPTGNSGQKPEGFTTEYKILGGLSVLLALLLRSSFRRTNSNGPNVRKVYDWYRMFQHFLSAGFFATVVVGVTIFAITNGQKALISLPMIVISIGIVLVAGFNSARNAIVIIDKDDDRITYPRLFSLLTSSVKISEIEDIGSDVQLEHSSQGLLAGLFGMAALASQEKEVVEIICLIGKFGTVSITFSSSFKYQETLNAIRQARKN